MESIKNINIISLDQNKFDKLLFFKLLFSFSFEDETITIKQSQEELNYSFL